VEDLAQGLLNAIDCSLAQGKIYNLAGPRPISFDELIDVARMAVGSNTRTVRVPLIPSIAMVRTYERYSSKPRLRAEQVERLAEDKSFSINAAQTDLGFKPRTFEAGVAEEVRLLWPT
jgi:nucleoside-diphosphate-sugar epimerase